MAERMIKIINWPPEDELLSMLALFEGVIIGTRQETCKWVWKNLTARS
jgi:hypothetical protein